MNSSPGGFNQPVVLSGAKLGIGSFGSADAGDSIATAHMNAAAATHTPNCHRDRSPIAHLGIGASVKDVPRYHTVDRPGQTQRSALRRPSPRRNLPVAEPVGAHYIPP